MYFQRIKMVLQNVKYGFIGLVFLVCVLTGQFLNSRCLVNQQFIALSPQTVTSPGVSRGNLTRNFITIFISFTLMTDSSFRKDNFNIMTTSQLENRTLDFVESVQYSLYHPYVLEVYLLYNQDAVPAYAHKTFWGQSKLKLVRLEDPYRYLNVFDYVHANFRDQLVMITNADVYPDEGFDKISYDLMKTKRLMYIPTRHGRQEKRCNMFPGQCDKVYRPPGAHDSYIFIPTTPIPTEGRPLLNKTWDTWGMENVILHVYQKMMHYRPINPCKAVFIYHNHCSKIRHNDRKRFDIAPESQREYALPTDKME